MNGYNNPEIFVDPAPVGVDWAIEKCRLALFNNVPWLQKRFPRAIIQQRRNEKGVSEFFPEVWGRNREPMNLMPNDNLSAFSFFVARDPETPAGTYEAFQQVVLQRPVSLIVWANLQLLDDTKKYRFGESLKLHLLKTLSNVPDFRFTQTFEGWNRVYEGFTLTEIFQPFLKPPFYAVRIDGILSFPAFPENCMIPENPRYLLNDDGTLLLDDFGQPLQAD